MYWLYWENKDNHVPRNVKLFVTLIKRNVEHLTIVTNNTLCNYIDVLDASHLCVAQRVDYYRAKLLHKYGGIWLDIDTVMLGNIDDVYGTFLASDKEVCLSVTELPSNVCLQYLISKPKSKIFELWYKAIEAVVKKGISVRYTCFGSLLARIITRYNLSDTVLPFPNELIFRLGSKHYQKFYSLDAEHINKNMDTLKKEDKRLVILYGSTGMYQNPISKHCLLGRIIDHAFKKTSDCSEKSR